MIYLDHNATTPLDPVVLEAMLPWLQSDWGNPSSPYRFANRARAAVETARRDIAEVFGCAPGEIVFTSGGTESDNLAIRGTAQALRSKGNHIVTTAIEHHAVMNTCRALEKEGFRITWLPVSPGGTVRIDALRQSLTPDTILVSVMHANNETGVIQPIEEIANLARGHGIVFHTDAVQIAGKIPGALCNCGADLISFSGHKLYGPKGIGGLYRRNGTPLIPVATGGLQESGMRAGTENVSGIAGLARACTLAAESAMEEHGRLCRLRDRLETGIISTIPGVRINGAASARIPNTTNCSFDRVDGESVVLGLDILGICVATGSACSTGEPEPSHVLTAMGLSPMAAQGSIRISIGKGTEEKDIDSTVEALGKTVQRLRAISST